MFIGHFALAFVAKPAVPRTSLATLIAAAQLLDLLWPIFVLLGVETLRVEPGPDPFLHRPARDRAGQWGFWSLVALLFAVYLASIFGPPPPGPGAVAASALVLWALIPWVAWFDRHRGPAWQP
jgi:hypothetical protein